MPNPVQQDRQVFMCALMCLARLDLTERSMPLRF